MKIKYLSTLLFIFTSLVIYSQRPKADLIKSKTGSIKIQPILHSTFVLQWNNKTIYIDPYGGTNAFKEIDNPDMIIITDIHGDHLDLETLKKIAPEKTIFITPRAVADKLPIIYHENLIILNNNETTKQLGIQIKAIAMYNLPDEPDSKHPKGRGNGYILSMGEKNIYISGDTEDINEMRSLKNIHVAFVCMNLPYTMDINQAASAVLEFKPKIVYPFHYRGKPDMSDTQAFKNLVNNKNSNIEVRLRNWYPEYD
ncbi:MAG: MBL fold metallo-hydrolase [Bacteroidota bacterium]